MRKVSAQRKFLNCFQTSLLVFLIDKMSLKFSAKSVYIFFVLQSWITLMASTLLTQFLINV